MTDLSKLSEYQLITYMSLAESVLTNTKVDNPEYDPEYWTTVVIDCHNELTRRIEAIWPKVKQNEKEA